mgnify:CR=1 FL=1
MSLSVSMKCYMKFHELVHFYNRGLLRDETLANLYRELGNDFGKIATQASRILTRAYTALSVRARLTQLGIITPSASTVAQR